MKNKTKHFFVYGTLKEGGELSDSSGIANLRVKVVDAKITGFDMFDLGWFPGILPGEGIVNGELHEYKKPETVTSILDSIEGYREADKDNSLYLRKEIDVETDDGKTVKASIYVFNKKLNSNAKKIKNGTWEV